MSNTRDSWFMVPELTHGPFLAINLSNRKKSSKKQNDALMAVAKTGNWDIPSIASQGGLKGKTVVLFYSEPHLPSRLYVGEIKSGRVVGKTRHIKPRSRYELKVEQVWKEVGRTESNFSEFFAGFRMSSNPTVVWMDIQNYKPTTDIDSEVDAVSGLPPLIPPGMSFMAWVALRANHHIFVKNLKKARGDACSLTGIKAPFLVHAAHIVPWSKANWEEQTSEHNGLMLCAHLHALFDAFLLSFDNDGRILFSKKIPDNVRKLVISGGGNGRLRHKPSPEQGVYLERHRAAAPVGTNWSAS